MVSELTVTNARISPALCAHLNGLRSHLAERIRGQDHVIDRMVSVLIRGELGFAHPRRPRGATLKVGPTGTGKTETTNVFTGYLFAGAAPIRFDMSEYQLQGSVEKLIGGARDDPGLLGRAVRGVTRGTLLFDEIEKAHPLLLDLFLQVLEDGRITIATGETLDLRGFYVDFTSNIGSEETMRMENAPFASVERTVMMRVRERLRPELLGRINEIIVFACLDYKTQRAICEGMIVEEIARLALLGCRLEIGSDVIEFLVRAGYHRLHGARPMRGAVARFLQEAAATSLLAGHSGSGRTIVDANATRLIIA